MFGPSRETLAGRLETQKHPNRDRDGDRGQQCWTTQRGCCLPLVSNVTTQIRGLGSLFEKGGGLRRVYAPDTQRSVRSPGRFDTLLVSEDIALALYQYKSRVSLMLYRAN